MRMEVWRIGGAALLALALAGGAAAQEAEPGWGVDEDGVPISGDGVDGEVTVTDCGGCDESGAFPGGDESAHEEGPPVFEENGEPVYADLPPGFCEDCVEDGEIVEEVLADGGASIAGRGRSDAERGGSEFRGVSWRYLDAPVAARAPVAGACDSVEGLDALLCQLAEAR